VNTLELRQPVFSEIPILVGLSPEFRRQMVEFHLAQVHLLEPRGVRRSSNS